MVCEAFPFFLINPQTSKALFYNFFFFYFDLSVYTRRKKDSTLSFFSIPIKKLGYPWSCKLSLWIFFSPPSRAHIDKRRFRFLSHLSGHSMWQTSKQKKQRRQRSRRKNRICSININLEGATGTCIVTRRFDIPYSIFYLAYLVFRFFLSFRVRYFSDRNYFIDYAKIFNLHSLSVFLSSHEFHTSIAKVAYYAKLSLMVFKEIWQKFTAQ